MTEDEAKTKWCPHARIASDTGLAFNRWTSGEATGDGSPALCLASDCAAWRWSEAKRTAAFLDAVQEHMKASGKPNFAAATQAVYAERGRDFEHTEGFCGLAVAPQ